ncbi:MAG: ABC transporter permease, partial [Firmicutes bacterium]|nr:ABC transporter permease [Bacillota bacterium]
MSAHLRWQATLETLYMTGVATLLAHLAGIPTGVLLVVTDRGHVLEHRWLHEVLAA